MKVNSVDWVWSSGLLEHFSEQEILHIVKESVNICKKGVMSLVPNARAIPYRVGKFKMERENNWPYGKEIPKTTMRNFFEAVGLKNIKEYSIGTYHFEFWHNDDIKNFYNNLGSEELQALNQGYLIFTYGEK